MTKSDPIRETFPRKFGKYHLLGPLAQGGMGALYLAVTGSFGMERFLVIKTVLPHLADAEYVSRFRDEAKVVVKLSHGNLVPVFDAGQVGGELFLAMDFVEGKDLRAVWNRCAKKGVAFPIEVAVYVVKELCRGLAYAHSSGDLKLVHRDISPPNILLSYSGEVKLTDFGLASSTLKLEKTAPGIIYGKVSYMSPEQARGEPLDGRSDLYAAGIILWELLTGRQLFPPGKEQPTDLLKRAKNPSVKNPSERAPRVPSELDAVCLKALAPRREDRYADADAFRQALSRWLAVAAPATDAVRIESFLSRLFGEEIPVERAQRLELIDRTREELRTLAPDEDVDAMLAYGSEDSAGSFDRERNRDHDTDADGDGRGRDRRDSPGRRVTDRGQAARERRADQRDNETARGVAVEVPRAGAGGRTVITPPAGTVGLAAALEREALPRPPSEDVGQLLDDRYRLAELIGEGGMGRVYLAEHVEIGKRVAVKILHPVYSRLPELVERFRREARAASRIGHPHIVDVTDSGTTSDGSVYFVMEYLEGIELATVIEREHALEVPRALRIASQICRALAAAHAVSIIHRDLKPENVFLTARDGVPDFVKVLDFGIAKSGEAEEAREKRLTHPGMAMGTPEYMAPEQAAGKPADERTDIYAVGAILYEMLTGTPPYEGENFMEILNKKATIEPRPPAELRPDIPAEVAALVDQTMSRDPALRPSSMKALDYELTKCLSGRGAAVARALGVKADRALLASLNPGFAPTSEEDAWELGNTPPPMTRTTTLEVQMEVPPSGMVVEGGRYDESRPSRGRGFMLGLAAAITVVLAVGGWLYLSWKEAGQRAASGNAARGPLADATRPAGVEAGLPRGAAATPGTDEGGDAAPAPGDPAALPGSRETAVPGPSPSPVPAPTPTPPVAPPETPPETATGPERSGGQEPESPEIGAGDAHRGRHDGPPRSRSDADRMLRQAQAAKARMSWEEARSLYQRVAAGRFKSRNGYLGLAEIAFETKQTDQVIHYANKAGKSARALLLLGHAHYKRAEYARALDYYQKVIEQAPDSKEAQRSAEAARQRLGGK